MEHVSLAHKKNEKGVRREYDKTVETNKKRGNGTCEMWRPAKQSSSRLDGALRTMLPASHGGHTSPYSIAI